MDGAAFASMLGDNSGAQTYINTAQQIVHLTCFSANVSRRPSRPFGILAQIIIWRITRLFVVLIH